MKTLKDDPIKAAWKLWNAATTRYYKTRYSSDVPTVSDLVYQINSIEEALLLLDPVWKLTSGGY